MTDHEAKIIAAYGVHHSDENDVDRIELCEIDLENPLQSLIEVMKMEEWGSGFTDVKVEILESQPMLVFLDRGNRNFSCPRFRISGSYSDDGSFTETTYHVAPDCWHGDLQVCGFDSVVTVKIGGDAAPILEALGIEEIKA
jgi:hypothetical protein